jgi:hypothetical protein
MYHSASPPLWLLHAIPLKIYHGIAATANEKTGWSAPTGFVSSRGYPARNIPEILQRQKNIDIHAFPPQNSSLSIISKPADPDVNQRVV